MLEPKHPIPLDYKTPEKGKRITTWTVIGRAIVGLFGMFWLIVALALTASGIGVFADSLSNENPSREIVGILGLLALALVAWFFSMSSFLYAIAGKLRKVRNEFYE